MQTLSEIRQLLSERGLRPKHRLGQNFLHDKNQLAKLLDAANVQSGDVILEVGPGTGTLTSALLERGARVIACELDQDMAGIIEEVFVDHLIASEISSTRHEHKDEGTLKLIKGDALAKDRRLNPHILQAIGDRSFKLVANLPYQIASALMSALLIDHAPTLDTGTKGKAAACTGQFVTIQKEVAERLQAEPSTKEYGPLSIIVQAFGTVKRIATLGPSCFWPPPEVTSTMIAILPREQLTGGDEGSASPEHNAFTSSEDKRRFARFITDLFSKRRKQLGSILGRDKFEWSDEITPTMRPEELTVNQLVKLWIAVSG